MRIKILMMAAALALPCSSVFAQSGDQLATIANGMPVGSWAKVPQNSSINTALVAAGGSRLVFAGSFGWDMNRHIAHFVGQYHGETAPLNQLRYITFDESTNDWTIVCGNSSPQDCGPNPTDTPGSCVTVGMPCGPGSGHGYYHTDVDSITGTAYYKYFGGAGTRLLITQYPIGGPWTMIHNDNVHTNLADACRWWSGQLLDPSQTSGSAAVNANGGHSDNAGQYVCQLGPTGRVVAFSPRQSSLFLEEVQADGSPGWDCCSGGGAYHNEAAYSLTCNCMVYGGGNNDLRTFIRMDSNQHATRLTDAPFDIGVDHGANFGVDPVSGHFIAVGPASGDTNCATTTVLVYELDALAPNAISGRDGVWTQLTGDNVPPAWGASGITGGISNMTCGSGGDISAPIQHLGVIMYVSSTGFDTQVWLFKVHGPEAFAARAAASGVVYSQGFDADAALGVRGNHDATQVGTVSGSFNNMVGSDCSTIALCPVIDTSFKASGTGSMHFQIPATSDAGAGGQWFANLSNAFLTGTPFGFNANQHFYVQWRQYMDADFVANGLTGNWGGGGGWKQALITAADPQVPSGPAGSCQLMELTPQNTNNRGFPQGYNGQPGCSSGSPQPSKPFEEFVPGTGGTDLYLENARANPYCLYSQQSGGPPPPGTNNCLLWPSAQWVTWLYDIQLGPRGTDGYINTVTKAGTAPASSGSLSAQAQDLRTCNGALASFDISWTSGSAYTVAVHSGAGGSAYIVGCVITILGTHFTSGSSPANDLTITVASILDEQVGAAPNDVWVHSHVNVFFAPDGGFYSQLFNFDIGVNADLTADDYKYGKIFLLPYDTSRSASGYPVSNTWYDELIVSTTRPNVPTHTGGPIYYTATTGDDSNTCAQALSISTPKLTIAGGLSCLASGDTLIIEDGTYAEGIEKDAIPSGVDASNRTTVRAANRGMVTLNTLNADSAVIMVEHKDFITIDGINADASGTATATPGVVVLGGDGSTPSNGSTYLTYQYGTIIGNIGSGCLGSHGYPSGNSTHITVSHATIHDCGYMSGSTTIHGLYVNWANSLIEYSTVYNTDGSCILIFSSDSTYDASNDTVNGNTAHNCGNVPLRSGSGTGQIWSNNVGYSGGAVIGGSAGVWVDNTNGGTEYIYNNTLYNNTGKCIHSNEAAGTIVAKNNICRSNSSNSIDGNGGTVTTATNTFTDPSFVNAGTADFHLQATSTAIGAGTDLSASFTTDADGLTRTVPWDLGAYRSSPCSVADHLTFTSQPSNAVVGASVGIITVEVQDAGNNACAGDTSTITLSKHSGDCTGMMLNGTVSGANTFTTTSLNMTVATGSCSLDATDGALTGATSSSFTISAAPVTPHAGHIRFRK